MSGFKYTATCCALLAVVACAGVARADDIVVGGTAATNIITALNDLGEPFTDVSPNIPEPGDGHIIILGMDGGIAPMPDYNAWLNGGGDLIVTGGSSLDGWRNWVTGYFNTNDTGGGWHTDGAWHTLVDHPANDGLPADYNFANSGHTFHMLGFADDTPNTTLLGNNDEPNNIAAFRDYDNLGSFNYMALDLGPRNLDQAEFITPWVAAALGAARIPEPTTLSLLALGGLLALRRRS